VQAITLFLVMTVEINGTHGRTCLMPGIYSGNTGTRTGANIPSMRSTFLRGSSLTKVDTTIAALACRDAHRVRFVAVIMF